MSNDSRTQTLTLLALAALAAPAAASIVSVAGQCTQISPPLACGNNQLLGANAFAWDELQGVPLVGVLCDETMNPGGSATPTFGAVSGTFDSHFISFQGVPNFTAVGSVTFNTPIVGVIWKNSLLDITDAPLGSPGTVYPTSYFLRGLNATNSTVSILGNTISFSLTTNTAAGEVAQIRVLTHSVPAPGAAALLVGAAIPATRRRRPA